MNSNLQGGYLARHPPLAGTDSTKPAGTTVESARTRGWGVVLGFMMGSGLAGGVANPDDGNPG
jgi:hypothetical protein